jgi:hypothetical protein
MTTGTEVYSYSKVVDDTVGTNESEQDAYLTALGYDASLFHHRCEGIPQQDSSFDRQQVASVDDRGHDSPMILNMNRFVPGRSKSCGE